MPKFSPIPRLTIIVPVGNDTAAFENSLVSVLENRPADCEILVAHDGRYDDPFDLTDEVSFVVTESHHRLDLLLETGKRARGRFIHVLADSMVATDCWTEPALERFENADVFVVAPVVRYLDTDRILAAGWYDSPAGLCQPLAAGQRKLSSRDATRIDGAFLQASFWRRELFVSLGETLRTTDIVQSVYAHTLVARHLGLKATLAVDSDVRCCAAKLEGTTPSFSRGQSLRAIHDLICESSSGALAGSAKAFLSNLFRTSRYSEALGQAAASLVSKQLRRRLDTQAIEELLDKADSIRAFPAESDSYRRAA